MQKRELGPPAVVLAALPIATPGQRLQYWMAPHRHGRVYGSRPQWTTDEAWCPFVSHVTAHRKPL